MLNICIIFFKYLYPYPQARSESEVLGAPENERCWLSHDQGYSSALRLGAGGEGRVRLRVGEEEVEVDEDDVEKVRGRWMMWRR